MKTSTRGLLDAADARAAVRAIDAAAPGLRRRLSASLRGAMRGRPSSAHVYVRTYRELLNLLLAALHEERPDLVERDDAGRYCLALASGCSHSSVELLEAFAPEAPFSPWVQSQSPGTGVALHLLARTREVLPGLTPLALPSGATYPTLEGGPEAALRWMRLVRRELSTGESDLERIQTTFGLSATELAGLFGVRRQAVSSWLLQGAPAARAAKIATVAAIADILAHRLKPARIPGIARKPAPAYRGKTMLDLIAADRHEWLLESVRRSFDYASTA